jgi:hypothetical protein
MGKTGGEFLVFLYQIQGFWPLERVGRAWFSTDFSQRAFGVMDATPWGDGGSHRVTCRRDALHSQGRPGVKTKFGFIARI